MGLSRRIAAAVFRGHRTINAGGVRYRERTTEPLHRALSERGPGHKDYDALFSDAPPMRIRCSATRRYADILGPRLLEPYRLADPFVRPGMRVLDPRAETGFGAAALAERVGPSGAVVALDPDHESVRFARRRYALPNVSFEIGGVESLAGELDGAFDVIVAVDALRVGPPEGADHHRVLEELWRVLAPGGPLVVVQPLAGGPEPPGAPAPLSVVELGNALARLSPAPRLEPADTHELAAVVARKPRPEIQDGSRAPPGPYPPTT